MFELQGKKQGGGFRQVPPAPDSDLFYTLLPIQSSQRSFVCDDAKECDVYSFVPALHERLIFLHSVSIPHGVDISTSCLQHHQNQQQQHQRHVATVSEHPIHARVRGPGIGSPNIDREKLIAFQFHSCAALAFDAKQKAANKANTNVNSQHQHHVVVAGNVQLTSRAGACFVGLPCPSRSHLDRRSHSFLPALDLIRRRPQSLRRPSCMFPPSLNFIRRRRWQGCVPAIACSCSLSFSALDNSACLILALCKLPRSIHPAGQITFYLLEC